LNIIFEYNLINANYIKRDFPAIDCFDECNKIAFQITSNSKKEKIQYTIDKFVEKKLQSRYDLYIYITTHKINYQFNKINTNGIRFSSVNVLDYRDLIDKLNAQDINLEVIKKTYEFLNSEYYAYKNQESEREKYFNIIDDNLVALKILSHRPFYFFFTKFSTLTVFISGFFFLAIANKIPKPSELAMFFFLLGGFMLFGSIMWGLAKSADKDIDRMRGIVGNTLEHINAEIEKNFIQAQRNLVNAMDYIKVYRDELVGIEYNRNKNIVVSFVIYVLFYLLLSIIYFVVI